MNKLSGWILCALALAPLVAGAATDDDDGSYDFRKYKDLSSLQMTTENDLYGFYGTDEYYTNGFKLAYVTPSLNGDDADMNFRAHFGIEQEMYTPQSKFSADPVGDHPYSAWLYGMVGLSWEDESSIDLLTLRAGVVGPSALGKQIQSNVHDLLGISTFKGWNSQIRDEPGIDLDWNHTWRFRLIGARSGFGVDIMPRVGFDVGTVRDMAFAGAQLRFGRNLPADFGVQSSRDSAVDAAPVKLDSGGWWPESYYGFVDAQVECWAWNTALQGDIYHGAGGVSTNPCVGQFGFGVATYWHGTKIALGEYFRTEEFRGQQGVFNFGSITVSVAF